jgi:hypothetical protein
MLSRHASPSAFVFVHLPFAHREPAAQTSVHGAPGPGNGPSAHLPATHQALLPHWTLSEHEAPSALAGEHRPFKQ